MEAKLLNLQEWKVTRLSHTRILRCIGQNLETLDLKALTLRYQGDAYVVQGWYKGTSSSVDVELRYTLDDVKRLDAEGRKNRRGVTRKAGLLNLSHILRVAGTYVDLSEGRLLTLSWQYQADKIQSITIQYELRDNERKDGERPGSIVEEVCVHIYRQRKKMPGNSDKSAYRQTLARILQPAT